MKLNSWTAVIGTVALAAGVILAAANLWYGELNQDEGWYLYAASQVAEGRVPYADFAYTQAPLLPLVYSAADSLVRTWGLAGGRLFTTLLGLTAALGAAVLAGRTVPRPWVPAARTLALVLVLVNVYQSYFTTVVKTYSLTALFLLAGLLFLSRTRRDQWIGPVLAGLFLALAAGTRLSAGLVLPVAGLYLLGHRVRLGDRPWAAFGAGGALALAAIFGPFALTSLEGMLFGVWGYHTGRSAGSATAWWAYKAAFLSRFVQAYFVFVLLLVVRVLLGGLRLLPAAEKAPAEEDTEAPPRFITMLWLAGLAMTALHMASAFPYDDYQVIVFPILAVALSGSLVNLLIRGDVADPEAEWIQGDRRDGWMALLLLTALLGSLAAAVSSPINQSWFNAGRDRIWWPMKERSDLQVLRDTAAGLRAETQPGDLLLTQDTYLAVEAGLRVPPGLEMGAFSYFPDMDGSTADRLRVLNGQRLADLIDAAPAARAAFSGYGFAAACPAVEPLSTSERAAWLERLEQSYKKTAEVPGFGQGHTVLKLYQRREP